MFEYDLTGKQVILVLEKDILKYLKLGGIGGSPLFARVHKMEESGLWLESDSYPVCPLDIPKRRGASDEVFCRAHIFIPARAVVSVVAFPEDASHLGNDRQLHRVGFKPPELARGR